MIIFCLKWGTKYGNDYVIRLYNQCKKFIQVNFDFICVTDNPEKFHPNILIEDFTPYKIRPGKWGGCVFTAEKIKLLSDPKFTGKKILFDLDLLFFNDLTDYIISYEPSKPTFIKNKWLSNKHICLNYGHITCDINSSFIFTKDNLTLNLCNNIFSEDYDYFALKYKSLDKTLFYRFQELINFHPVDKLSYSYSNGAQYPHDRELYKFRPDYKICMFNNSHGRGYDLHELNNWASDYWKSFDGI